MWRPWGEQGGFSVLAGGRYTDLDDRYKLSIPQSGRPVGTLDTSRDFLDALVGVRQIFTLADRWSLAARADYSDGDSKGIYQLSNNIPGSGAIWKWIARRHCAKCVMRRRPSVVWMPPLAG